MTAQLAFYDSPIGRLTLVADAGALAALQLPESADRPPPPAAARPSHAPTAPVLAAAIAQLGDYFAGRRTDFDLPLSARGTAFQRAVWAELAGIPYGATTTYGAVARAIGKPRAVRAVGAANGKNPLAIIVPCHRVIGAGGALTGYGGGLPTKRWLLAHEAAVLAAREPA